MSKPVLSLVLPCFNEAEHFTKSIDIIVSELIKSQIPYEIIFVEDKSNDTTKQIVEHFINTYPRLRLKTVYHKQNQGRGQSVMDGMRIAKGTYAGYMDIDCEISPRYITQFIQKLETGYEVVCAHRTYQISASGIIRAIASKTYSLAVKIALSSKLTDTEAGFKFFNLKKVNPIIKKIKNKSWFWDTEVMILSERAGLKISFIPVLFKRRTDKTSTVRLWHDTLDYIRNLVRFRQELKQMYGK